MSQSDLRVKKQIENQNKVLTEKELAAELGLFPSMVRRMRLTEGLPCVVLGRRYLYRMEAVNAWFAAKEAQSCNQEPEPQYGRLRRID